MDHGVASHKTSNRGGSAPAIRRGLQLRSRIMLPLALPVLGLLALSGVILLEKRQTLVEMERVDVVSSFVTEASALVHELVNTSRSTPRNAETAF